MKYIPSGKEDIKKMLNAIGVNSFEELIKHIPEHLIDTQIPLEKGISEYELLKQVKSIANNINNEYISFMGGGIYDHYIPNAIKHIVLRPEFYTAYTPYQAEVSQGTLQIIYEFQSMICSLYSMEISNASMYDGATASAEACHMAISITNKKKIIIADTLHPFIKNVINSYLKGQSVEYSFVQMDNYRIDMNKLKELIENDTAAFIIQTPNFFGYLENMQEISEIVKNTNTMLIVNQNPMSLGIIKPPGEYNADIAIGEAQPLGINKAFGGPLLGVFTSLKKYARYMPGRIIGMSEDNKGNRGFVMTLQTREQHIRREKATSNICTNEGLCMLMSCVYLALLGKKGFKCVSQHSFDAAHYLQRELSAIKGIKIIGEHEFFNEFTVYIDNLNKVYNDMKHRGYLIGVKLQRFDNKYENMLLMAVTEKQNKQQIDTFINELKEVVK